MISFSFFHEAAKNTPAAQALRRKAESQKDLRRKKIAKTAVAGNQALQGVTAKDESKPKSKIAQAQASKSVKSFSQAQRDARRQDLQGRADQIKRGRKVLGTAGKIAKGISTKTRKVSSTGQGFGKADAGATGGSGSGMRGTMNALGSATRSIRRTLGTEPGQTRSAVGKAIGTAVKKKLDSRRKPGLHTGVTSPKRDVQGLDAKQRLKRMKKFKSDKSPNLVGKVRKWGNAVLEKEEFSCWREEFIWETDKKYPDKVKEIKPMTGKNTIIINPNDEADKYSGR